jgi:divalent metal cation (Fe/Co/Zn/Cd) transporter
MHIELNECLSLQRSHQIADEVEKSIMRLLPDTEVLIHQDPSDDS